MPHLHFCPMSHSMCIFYHMACVHFLIHATPAFLTTRHTCTSYHSPNLHFLPYATPAFLTTRLTCIFLPHGPCTFLTTGHTCISYPTSHLHFLPHATPAFLPHATPAFLQNASHLDFLPHASPKFLPDATYTWVSYPNANCPFLPPLIPWAFFTTSCHNCIAYHTPHVNSYHMPHTLVSYQLPIVHSESLSSLEHFLPQQCHRCFSYRMPNVLILTHVKRKTFAPGGLSRLTNSALVYEPTEYSCACTCTWSSNKLWRSDSIFNLCYALLAHGL
jgi:hypothetical protein